MPPVFRLASALAILAALHGSALAQAAGGQLRGRVTDETAGVLPGVTVELRAESNAPPSVAVTTMAGEYAFDGLAPGTYQLSIAGLHGAFGSARWRYFGPRSLIEDNSVQSEATSLVNLEGGYQPAKNVRVAVDVFNLLNSQASDIDYYYATRLPGEPREGVNDLAFHPTLPRTARVNLIVSF